MDKEVISPGQLGPVSHCFCKRLLSPAVATVAVAVAVAVAIMIWPAALPRAAATEAVFTVRKGPSGYWLYAPEGAPLLHFSPKMSVKYLASGTLVSQVLKFEFQPPVRLDKDAWELTAAANHGPLAYQLRLRHQPASGELELSLLAQYRSPVLIRQETLQLSTAPGLAAQGLDRAYRLIQQRRVLFLDDLTPHYATFSHRGDDPLAAFTLARTDGATGFWLRPRRQRSFSLELELDNAANHPRVLYQPPRIHRTNRQMQALRIQRADENHLPAGYSRELRAIFTVGHSVNIFAARYPEGRRAAIIFTDHADQSSAAKLEALTFGRTGALQEGAVGPQHPGLVNRGLVYTKSIFLQQAARYSAQFDDPSYRRILGELHRRGVEIAVHSPSGIPDMPTDSLPLLDDFRLAFAGRTWIDHQPTTNCEAISSLGALPNNPYFILPSLYEKNFRFFWSAKDLPLLHRSLNLLAPERPALRRPVIFTRADMNGGQPGSPAPTFFSTANLFTKLNKVEALLSPQNITRLEEERGLLIAHVYLDACRRVGRYLDRQLLVEDGALGRYRLRPEVDTIFQHLASEQRRGLIWVTTIEALLSHINAVRAMKMSSLADGVIELAAPRGQPIRGLTLLLPPSVSEVLALNKRPITFKAAGNPGEWAQVVLDLPSSGTTRLKLQNASGRPISLSSPSRISLSE